MYRFYVDQIQNTVFFVYIFYQTYLKKAQKFRLKINFYSIIYRMSNTEKLNKQLNENEEMRKLQEKQ